MTGPRLTQAQRPEINEDPKKYWIGNCHRDVLILAKKNEEETQLNEQEAKPNCPIARLFQSTLVLKHQKCYYFGNAVLTGIVKANARESGPRFCKKS